MSREKSINCVRGALTAKQGRFVQEYLIDLNATAAAQRAGYKEPNKQGPRLLVNVGIAKAIKVALAERSARTNITVDLVVQETWQNYRRCVEAEEYGAANKSLELLGRHVGAFPNKHEHSGPGGGAVPIKVVGIEIVPPAPPRKGTDNARDIPL